MKKLLAVFAHPVDETFICGGTLAKCAAQGAEIRLLCATKGENGRRLGDPAFATRKPLPQVRERELRAACDVLGIQYLEFLGISDQAVEADRLVVIERTLQAVLTWQPDAVVTFTANSALANHEDHRAVANAVLEAEREWRQQLSNVLLFGVCGRGEAQHPKDLTVRPEQIVKVDVTEFAEKKLAAYRAHRSQSEQERGILAADEVILPYMREPEYFIQMNGMIKGGKTQLL